MFNTKSGYCLDRLATSAFEGVNPELARRFTQMRNDMPPGIGGVRIVSGCRPVQKQDVIWQHALRQYGSAAKARRHAAPPGHSRHNFGEALDLYFETPAAKRWVRANSRRYGLWPRVADLYGTDDMHYELLPELQPKLPFMK
jgi:hypothetical protein